MKALFGMTDMDQIALGVVAMYGELTELRASTSSVRPSLSEKVSEQEGRITALASSRDQAQAAREKWEAKAISSTQEIERLRQEIKEHGKWEIVDEEELATFFPTITLGEGEEPFLSSSRRQRRLMQRLSAEGYSIRKKK